MKQSSNKTMKVAVAMSGGVDSSVAAKILRDEGHKVIGLFLKLWSDPMCKIDKENRCCDFEALEDARRVAAKLNIPFYVINAQDEFKKEVVDYFLEEYKNGRTPNPCIVCNNKIKFGLLLKKALEIGCQKLATGHYARIKDSRISNFQFPISKQIPNSNIENKKQNNDLTVNQLYTGLDKTKDQSYMLYHLNQIQLSKVLFPLGDMTKMKVRRQAKKWNLPLKEKPESQEICFFGDKDYRQFLKRYLPEKYFKSGKIVDKIGNVVGEHRGLINYTIGQRKGVDQSLEVSGQWSVENNRKPLYVTGFDTKNNRLIVGEDKAVYKKEMIVSDLNWINPEFKHNKLSVKIRYRHPAVECTICHPERGEGSIFRDSLALPQNDSQIHVVFDKPQRAVTPGQSAVFYKGNEVLGGGIIIK